MRQRSTSRSRVHHPEDICANAQCGASTNTYLLALLVFAAIVALALHALDDVGMGPDTPISVDATDVPLDVALQQAFKPLKLDWVVDARAPFAGPAAVLAYLSRYTHRVAIANSRLQSIDHGQVTFTYKDYRHQHRQRTLTLSATEFIRRFMMHVLPHGFVRIRYYGFLANAQRQQLTKIRQLLNVPDSESSDQQADGDLLEQEQDLEPDPCPRCQQGQMQLIETVPRPTVPQILELPLMVPM